MQDTADNLELRALLERAQQGDAAAFSDLYGKYASNVLRFLVARLRDHELAQDLTQEVFIRILKSIGTFKYQGERSFLSWIYAIASNVMISHIRRAKATHLSLGDDLEIADPNGQEAVSGIFNRVSLQQAISQLTGDQQQVLMLRYYGDLSNAEIARQMNKTEGAVKALQHRALQTLQTLIGREGGEPAPRHEAPKQLDDVAVLHQRQRSSGSDDVEAAATVRVGYWQ